MWLQWSRRAEIIIVRSDFFYKVHHVIYDMFHYTYKIWISCYVYVETFEFPITILHLNAVVVWMTLWLLQILFLLYFSVKMLVVDAIAQILYF